MNSSNDSKSSEQDKIEKLGKIVREVLNLDGAFDLNALSAKDHPSWDSLRHVELCLRIQNEFQIKIDGRDLVQMRTYADIERVVRARLKA